MKERGTDLVVHRPSDLRDVGQPAGELCTVRVNVQEHVNAQHVPVPSKAGTLLFP